MTAEDVDAAILRPMQAMFPPPRHLRADEDARDAALAAYRGALARFDRRVLERGWDRVVAAHAFWCWPKLSEIVRACEEAGRDKRASRQVDDWSVRARREADEYTRRFMRTSKRAARARESGCERRLRGYVAECAYVQSQVLMGHDGVACEAYQLFGRNPTRQERDDLLGRLREQAERAGRIRVAVPPTLIQRWWREDAPGGSR